MSQRSYLSLCKINAIVKSVKRIFVLRGSFNPSTLDHFKLMTEILTAKFGQIAELYELLLSTGDAILVEASPYDRIWGIGIGCEEAMAGGVEQWRGENLLGCALMQVRDYLRETDSLTNNE